MKAMKDMTLEELYDRPVKEAFGDFEKESMAELDKLRKTKGPRSFKEVKSKNSVLTNKFLIKSCAFMLALFCLALVSCYLMGYNPLTPMFA